MSTLYFRVIKRQLGDGWQSQDIDMPSLAAMQLLVSTYGAQFNDLIAVTVPTWADVPWLFQQLQQKVKETDQRLCEAAMAVKERHKIEKTNNESMPDTTEIVRLYTSTKHARVPQSWQQISLWHPVAELNNGQQIIDPYGQLLW
jgi:hypothetical protein